jgi:hypothetical protein
MEPSRQICKVILIILSPLNLTFLVPSVDLSYPTDPSTSQKSTNGFIPLPSLLGHPITVAIAITITITITITFAITIAITITCLPL